MKERNIEILDQINVTVRVSVSVSVCFFYFACIHQPSQMLYILKSCSY